MTFHCLRDGLSDRVTYCLESLSTTLRELQQGHFLQRALRAFFPSFLAWNSLNLLTQTEYSANCIAFGKALVGEVEISTDK